MGAALVAPRLALAQADREQAAGRAGSDAAWLIAMVFVAAHLPQLVIAVWLAVAVGLGVGANALAMAVSGAVATQLIVLFAAAAMLWLAAGRTRSLGRDFDLACVAFVPYLAVEALATLIFELAGAGGWRPGEVATMVASTVAFGWTAVVLGLAWQQARSRRQVAS